MCVRVSELDSFPTQCRCAVDSFISAGSGLLRGEESGEERKGSSRGERKAASVMILVFIWAVPFISLYNTEQSQNTRSLS